MMHSLAGSLVVQPRSWSSHMSRCVFLVIEEKTFTRILLCVGFEGDVRSHCGGV